MEEKENAQSSRTHEEKTPPIVEKESRNPPFPSANSLNPFGGPPPVHLRMQQILYNSTLSNLQSLKFNEQFASVKFVVHFKIPSNFPPKKGEKEKKEIISSLPLNSEEKESEEITKVFYGLKILFAAYSPVFDEMV